MIKKIKKIQKKLKKENCGIFLITNSSNIFYLTGIEGFSAEREFLMVISRKNFKFITSKLYQNKTEKEIPKKNLIIVEGRSSLFGEAVKIFGKYKNIGFERENLKYGEYEILKRNLKKKKIIPISGLVGELRKIKDKDEIKKIQKAAEIIDKTFYLILKIIKPGLSEKFIQRKIIEIMEDLGADGVSFEPIVAGGKESADPHHQSLDKKIRSGEMLLIDMGAKYKGYCSDLSRTIFVGKAPSKFKKLYEIVLKTQKEAIEKCEEGYSIKNLHKNAVFNFKKYKQDKYFVHSLGHGVGIDIHEFPGISVKSKGNFEKGMIITIEPGLYHKNFGGIRIEDLCLIDQGCEVLSKATKKLIEIKA